MDLEAARNAVKTWPALARSGITRPQLRVELTAGHMRRIGRGAYVACSTWDAEYAEGRHLLNIIAATRRLSDRVVYSHLSAAALHGLPFYRFHPVRVHISGTAVDGRVKKSKPLVARHQIAIPDADVTVHNGIRCTSLARTVADCIRIVTAEQAIVIADAALRKVAWDSRTRTYDERAAQRFRAEVMARLPKGGRGVRQARYILELADGRAESPGESVSRLYLIQLGFRTPLLQVPVRGPKGADYHLDLGLSEIKTFGEFDGKGKYLDDELRGDQDAESVVLAEKEREDWVRGVTGWRVIRWGWDDIDTIDTFRKRLRAFGIYPPPAS